MRLDQRFISWPTTWRSGAPLQDRHRSQIEADGYTIIANIGDQASDLQGGHAEKTFKLPNPFYIVK